jgi:cytoskeleton protein RodZ
LGTFGERLRREREMRGVSLDEIAKATKIGTRSLKALEQEEFGKLPGGIFNKGFVRSYAKFLGMDEDQAVADYVVAAGEAEQSSDAVIERLAAESERRAEEKRIQRQREKKAEPFFTWNKIAVVVIIIVAAVLGSQYYAKRKAMKAEQTTPSVAAPSAATQPAAPTPTEAPTAAANTPAGVGPGNATIADNATTSNAGTSNATSAGATSPTLTGANAASTGASNASASTSSKPAASQHPKTSDQSTERLPATSASPVANAAHTGTGETATTSAAPSGPEFVVKVKANKESWVSSRADDKSIPGRILAPNAEATFRARNTLRLVIGNAGGVEISFNGKPLPPVGEANKSKTLVFTPAGQQ